MNIQVILFPYIKNVTKQHKRGGDGPQVKDVTTDGENPKRPRSRIISKF